MRYGTRQRHRLLYCRTRKARFAERKGTPRFGARRPRDQLLSAPAHIAGGCGARPTARLVGLSKGAASRPCRLTGDRARRPHDEPAGFPPRDRPGPAR